MAYFSHAGLLSQRSLQYALVFYGSYDPTGIPLLVMSAVLAVARVPVALGVFRGLVDSGGEGLGECKRACLANLY